MRWKLFLKDQNKKKNNCSNQPEIVLYTTGSHGARHLYECIDILAWLMKKKSNENKIEKTIPSVKCEIILLPVGSYIFKLPYQWTKRLKAIPKLDNFIKKDFRGRFNNHSLYHIVYSGKIVTLAYGQITICLKYFREKVFLHGYLLLKSVFNAFVYWKECFDKRSFIPSYFLKLHYKGIQIGDLVASTTLRANPKLGGSLQVCKELFIKLVEAIYICELANNLKLCENARNYVLVPEPTYLHTVYQRTLHARGVNIISYLSYKKKYFVVPPGKEFINPHFASKPIGEIIDSSMVISYMNSRLFDANKVLDYMVIGANNNYAKDIYDINGCIIDTSNNGLSVVIFLHSFDDAQYYFGLDGFNDLFQWTIFTIDTCLINSEIQKVLIKSHPNVDTDSYPGDRVAFDKILNIYKNNQKITFMKKSSSLIALSKIGKLYGITHHGSVAEELVYLGQPVIASTYAPWSDSFPFVKTWKNLEEYKKLITTISVDSWSPPLKAEREWLFRFIHEYRLKPIKLMKTLNLHKFAKVFVGKNVKYTIINDLRYEAELKELDPSSETFNDLMIELFKECIV